MQGWVVGFSDVGMHAEFTVDHGGQNVVVTSLTRVLFLHFEEFLHLPENNTEITHKRKTFTWFLVANWIPLADPRGAPETRPLPVPNSFIFISAKKLKNNSTFGDWGTPLGKILDPPLDTKVHSHQTKVKAFFDAWHFYRPQMKFAKVMFLHVSVILSTGAVCLSAYWDTIPQSRHPHPSRPGTPPRTRHLP